MTVAAWVIYCFVQTRTSDPTPVPPFPLVPAIVGQDLYCVIREARKKD